MVSQLKTNLSYVSIVITKLFSYFSNALRNDLIHPNEYVRGSTLRFISKVKVAELLEPLVPSVTKNLEHRYSIHNFIFFFYFFFLKCLPFFFFSKRHSYVRRNAVLALQSVYTKTPQLCPDAPELVYDFLKNVFILDLYC